MISAGPVDRSACPGEDTLAAFAAGQLTGRPLSEVADHAACCAACSQQLVAAHAISWNATAAVQMDTAELLDGRYLPLQKLGEGGMGVVYEAEDLVLGEHVALKTLRVELACDERALGYLKSEAKLARQIGHEHVCRVYDLGSQTINGSALHYISMELLRGPSLRRLLQAGPLDHRLALRLAEQVLQGLQAAHAAGVLHRDLKPDNILLRHPSPHEPHAVITDFGLARAFAAGQRHVSASRLLVGSAAYLAPEQMDEAPLTEATDLYSFGVVLFELLTGKLPFSAKTPLGVALRRLHMPPPRPSALCPELGQRYDAFVLRCLALAPRDRFPNAASARAALQKLIDAPSAGRARFAGARGKRLGAALISAGFACGVSVALGWGRAPEAWVDTPPLRAALTAEGARSRSATEPASAADFRAELPSQAAATHVPVAGLGECDTDSHVAYDSRRAAGSARPAHERPRRASVKKLPAPDRITGRLLTAEGFLDPFAD